MIRWGFLTVLCCILLCSAQTLSQHADTSENDQRLLEENKREADKRIDECREEIDSLPDAQIMHLVKSEIEKVVHYHLAVMELWYAGYQDMKIFGADPSVISQLTAAFDSDGNRLLFLTGKDCAKFGLKKLSKTKIADTKVFELMLDFYAFCEEVVNYYENPTGTSSYYYAKSQEFSSRSEQFSSKLEILMD